MLSMCVYLKSQRRENAISKQTNIWWMMLFLFLQQKTSLLLFAFLLRCWSVKINAVKIPLYLFWRFKCDARKNKRIKGFFLQFCFKNNYLNVKFLMAKYIYLFNNYSETFKINWIHHISIKCLRNIDSSNCNKCALKINYDYNQEFLLKYYFCVWVLMMAHPLKRFMLH